MTKWADYCIVAVTYSPGRSAIAQVKARPHDGRSLGDACYFSRDEVVRAVLRGTTFTTAVYRDGLWYQGADIHVVEVNGHYYLRTDANRRAEDNLGNLPEY